MKASAPARNPLISELESARRYLRQVLARSPESIWGVQPSEAYSPIGWHLGHVAAVQARWLLPGELPRHGPLFDPIATGKLSRAPQLPAPQEIRRYLDEVLERVCEGLRAGRVPGVLGLPETFLVQHVAQHELQHAEHVQVVTALCEKRLHKMPKPLAVHAADRLEFEGGTVTVGYSDPARAYDNERPQHQVRLRPFWLDRAPVTALQFAQFVKAGGYRERKHWTEQGWEWRATGDLRMPIAFRQQQPDAPVTCLSWYEADAYARWRGSRLPAEHELEASGVGPAGVWEWTSSWFAPYPGFRAYPYDGYSVPWFGTHRVLRGGSWATSGDLVRPSLRNWYVPEFRELPSGFRCAGDL